MRSRKKTKSTWKQMKMNTQQPKTYWTQTTKAVFRGKFTAVRAYLKKIEFFQIHDLTLYLQLLEEQQQTKPRGSRRKEIIKLRKGLNDIDSKKKNPKKQETIQRINESSSSFFEKINKID